MNRFLESGYAMPYVESRLQMFNTVSSALGADTVFTLPTCLVAQADSLSALKRLPSGSVSLILTDPPYHATKKQNITGDTSFATDDSYLDWMRQYTAEWHRILRPNGSLFCFCDSSMSARLEIMFSEKYNVLSHIVWTKPNEPGYDGWKGKMRKEALRQWYPHSERIIFAEPAVDGNLFRSHLAMMLKSWRKQAGCSTKDLAEKIGAYGRINHGGAVSNWEDGRNTPSREQYKKIKDALEATGKVSNIPPYEDAARPFFMDGKKEFTDVWTFPSVRNYCGKHPAEKPLEMLRHAIEATTFPGDIVLDCFAGSGNTAIAAIELNRLAISIEIENRWCESLIGKLSSINSKQFVINDLPAASPAKRRNRVYQPALDL